MVACLPCLADSQLLSLVSRWAQTNLNSVLLRLVSQANIRWRYHRNNFSIFTQILFTWFKWHNEEERCKEINFGKFKWRRCDESREKLNWYQINNQRKWERKEGKNLFFCSCNRSSSGLRRGPLSFYDRSRDWVSSVPLLDRSLVRHHRSPFCRRSRIGRRQIFHEVYERHFCWIRGNCFYLRSAVTNSWSEFVYSYLKLYCRNHEK